MEQKIIAYYVNELATVKHERIVLEVQLAQAQERIAELEAKQEPASEPAE